MAGSMGMVEGLGVAQAATISSSAIGRRRIILICTQVILISPINYIIISVCEIQNHC